MPGLPRNNLGSAFGPRYRISMPSRPHFFPRTMFVEQFATQERALYAAIVALEEGASLANQLADRFNPDTAAKLRDEARERHEQSEVLKQILLDRQSFTLG